MSSVNRHAVQRGMKFLRQYFVKMRDDAMKTKSLRYYPSSRDRMKASWLCVNAGGILPLARDELIPASIPDSVFDLEPYVLNAGGESTLLMTWFDEAQQQVKQPKILDDVANQALSDASPTLPEFGNPLDVRNRKRSTSDFADFDFE